MKKPVIGIMPTSEYLREESPVKDGYWFRNNYTSCLTKYNATPLLIPLVNEEIIPEALEMCDGLLLPGGGYVRPVNFEIVDYFFNAKKPMLGICLGFQTLAMYGARKDDPDSRVIKEIDNGFNHWPKDITREDRSFLCHKIRIDNNSKLYHLMNEEENPMVNSFHHKTVTDVGSIFKITAYSEDGLIEGLEYPKDDRFIVGVQFHPEHVDLWPKIFEEFIEKCKK